MATTSSVRFRFRNFELRPSERRLLADGLPVVLAPRAFDVLVVLVEQSGVLVTKDELLRRVWPRVVVEENAIQVQVSALRKLIGAQAVATVSRHGYRFELEVERVEVEPASALQAVRDNLPQPLTSFIGRRTEMAQLRRLLAGTRLLSLTGAGGSGKTRLALQVARDLVGVYEGGVWLVELAPVSRPEFVPSAVAKVLGVDELPGKSIASAIASRLGSTRTLLLLDNAEHLLAGVRTLVETLLGECVGLTVLVTSRERLGRAGEATYRLLPLSAPDPRRDVTAEQVEAFEAAELFVERVRLHRPHFAATDDNAAALAAVCHRLDGMPLAIELAAPRLRTMSIDEVHRRIDRRFALLTGGPRTALQRQRTLRAMVDWSYDLLSDDERALLRRLSVFAGGWTLGAAEAVCGAGATDPNGILHLLTSLADKSLVLADEEPGATRFDMLQTVQEYARERLTEDDDPVYWYSRHADYFLALVEGHADALRSNDASTIGMLEAEHDNLRAALVSSGAAGPTAVEVRLAAALQAFWWWRGYSGEALAFLSRALERKTGHDELPTRAAALSAAGLFAGTRGEYDGSRAFHREALEIRRALGDRDAVAASLLALGMTDYGQNRFDSARRLYEEALAIYRELGTDVGGVANALNNLGNVADQVGDYASARTFHEEALTIRRELGERTGVAISLNNLAVVDRNEGKLEAATARCELCLTLARDLGNTRLVMNCRGQLGMLACARGDYAAGLSLLGETLSALARLGDRSHMLEAVDAISNIVAERSPVEGARLWGARERAREASDMPLSQIDARRLEDLIARARAELGDDAAFDREWQTGRAVPPDELVPYVLAAIAQLPDST